MEKFIGSALLVDVSSYDSTDKKSGEVTKKFKYSFLCGTQDKKGDFVKNPTLESFISDSVLLSRIEFMREIKVAISLQSYMDKDKNGKLVMMFKPSYEVLKDEPLKV